MLRFQKITLAQILLIGFVFRFIAAVFSKGYAFSDDYLMMTEVVFKWRNNIPFAFGESVHVFSLLYPGLQYLIFEACNAIGITTPEHMMFVVNLIHALASMLTVYYAYLLTLRCTNNENLSKLVALVIAVLWIFPFLSVRTLREFFCLPFLLMGSYHLADKKLSNRSILLAAFLFAVAACIRLQSILFFAGFGLCLLFKKEYTVRSVITGLLFLLFFFLMQGTFDYFYYGNPLASTKAYLEYNSNPAHIELYPQGPWYQYIGTVAGIALGFPFFLLAWGYAYSYRVSFQAKMLLIGSLLFFVFHSFYSNKQERFIFPFVPYFILLGMVGYWHYYFRNEQKHWLRKATRFIIVWFVVLNTTGLLIFSFSYSKRSRVESMIYLRRNADVQNIVMEGEALTAPPMFYLGKPIDFYYVNILAYPEELKNELAAGKKAKPNYVIFVGNKNLEQRISRMQSLFPVMKKEKTVLPSFIDDIAHRLNPRHNVNQSWYIYRIK